jgi:DNA-binding SARP family transcriptional activator/tetratricopeptide (TPR) repeat protein
MRAVRFRILGPLEVRGDEGPLKLGGRKQQGLLALLLLRANETVSTEALIDGLWGEEPPESAANALQVYVSGLRKLVGADVLLTKPPGYVLRVDPEHLDAAHFEREIANGRQLIATGALAGAVETLAGALRLWRGRPLDGLRLGVSAEAEAARLDELRLSAVEDRVDAELRLGRHAHVVAELEALVAEQPHRERLAGLLMLALYRSGRQFEALEVYRATRRNLVEGLGLDPSPALHELERRILAQDPALGPESTASPEPRGESRRHVVVLSAELEAATRDGSLDPEAEQGVLGPAVTGAAGVLERNGALVECVGWRVRGIFGVPNVREDDARRAASAALELRRHLGSGAGRPGIDVSARIGIFAGEVVSGPGGLVGSTLRDAEALARQADPGEILLGERVRRLIGSAEVTEAGGGRWRLESIDDESEAIPRRFDLPFVGRRRELARLTDALEAAIESRRCGVAVVTGAPGIGKSRLTRELAARAESTATCVTGRCLSFGQGLTFLPLVEIVRQLAGPDIARGVKRLMRGDRQAALVAERLSVALGAAHGEAGQEQVFWAVRRLFEAAGRRHPLLVRLEDLHWADETLLDLVDYLGEWVRDAPMLVLVTARPELLDRRPEWRRPAEGRVVVPLEPLGQRDAGRMIADLLGPTAADESLQARIAGAAEGNPLFIEQMAAMVGEGSEQPTPLTVPPTIQALLAARVDLLGVEERVLLERAAVIGREFEAELVAALAQIETGEAAWTLEALRGRQLVAGADGSFRFCHQLIADAAYEMIPKLTRADLHERLAGLLANDPGFADQDEAIGYHLERAYQYRTELGAGPKEIVDLGRRAGSCLGSAGLRWYARGDASAAVGLLGRAVALPAETDEASAELLLALGSALRETGDLIGARAVVTEAAAVAEKAGRRDLFNEARVLGIRLRYLTEPDFTIDTLFAAAGEAIAELESLGSERGLSDAWFQIAWAHWLRCRAADAEEALERVVAHARAASHERYRAQAGVLRLGTALFGSLPVPDAIDRCRSVLAGRSIPPRLEAAAYRALAALTAMQGRFDEARGYLTRDEELIEEAGLRLTAAARADIAALIELLAGNPAAAEMWLRRGLETLPVGEVSGRSTQAAALADVLYRLGRLEEALELTEESERAAAADDRSVQVQWRAARAKALAACGRTDEALQLAAAALKLTEGTDFLLLQAFALLDAGEVLQLAGRPGGAAVRIRRAIRLFERKGNTVSASQAAALLAELQRTGVTRTATGKPRSSASAAAPASKQSTAAAGKSADGAAPSTAPAAAGPTANPIANEFVDSAM